MLLHRQTIDVVGKKEHKITYRGRRTEKVKLKTKLKIR
jgi:hypothetical protein